jgi:transposase
LTQQIKEQRVGFALEYSLKPLDFWQNVIFTDEKIFQSCYNGRIRVYRPPNTRFDERYTQKVVAHGRFSVNVWGWISAQGPGVLTHIIGRNNAEVHLHIMENIMLPSVNAVFPQNNFIYQHDNCPIYTARIISNWMEQQGIRVLPWPSRSPDLNPIENMWALMTRKMNTGNHFRPQNVEELWDRIQEEWNELTPNYTEVLVASMLRRLDNVIDKNGVATKY